MSYSRWQDAMIEQKARLEFQLTSAGRSTTQDMQDSLDFQYREDGIRGTPDDFFHSLLLETLHQADPVYIAPNVLELIDHARENWQPEPVLPTDPFTQVGFALFPRALVLDDSPVNTQQGFHVPIRAVAWIPVTANDSPPERAVSLGSQGCFWVFMFHHYEDDHLTGRPDEVSELLLRAHPNARLMLTHAFQWSWGDNPYLQYVDAAAEEEDPENAQVLAETAERARQQGALIQVMWRIGQQVVQTKERLPRPLRRDNARRQLRHEDVTVIHLRRGNQFDYDEPGDGPDWQYQWLVRGHWRNQWYPSLGEHRQVWINPYVKGPDDRPLKLTTRVFEFIR